jgi:hypothetical protein
MVKNNTLYSLSQFCKKFLGINLCVVEDCVTIRQILDQKGFGNLWDYPLSEIDHLVENDLDVVLVDASYVDESGRLIKDVRWVEMPCDAGIVEKIQ